MLDPKTFYRELDALLAKIRIERSDKDFLPFILSELQRNFGDRLHFSNGRIYELRGEDFVLIYPNSKAGKKVWADRIPRESETIQLVFKNRSYIYDDLPLNHIFLADDKAFDHVSTVIWVHSPERQWLIVFKLKDGWVREEISLFLNAVRTSINYRLFSEIMGGRLEQAVQ
ncbi:MAG: hypothetical protein GXO75_13950, partial [Calditrichaeota bacterium]|nr:hypothetical protein [Calditrichota bacterium]